MSTWLSITPAVTGGLLLFWLLTLAALALVRPRGGLLTEAIRLLPDLLRLIPRLARDQTLPRGVRVRLWLLLAYLAMPIDLVPDFIPVLGYADDAIVVAAVLRSVVRHAGADALARHWSGTDDGLTAVRRLAGLPATPAQEHSREGRS
ncbi:YkvA family protein [Streptomyces sp. NPDC001292]|uniref:YkvA family protein n=1 Tax=Streptomyces sp. NPDC001292 TaxID=3364558 RepID=UPI00369D6284